MANTLKFGNGEWAIKEGSALAYNDENGNFKPLPFDFTRASTATYVAEDGLIKTSAIGEPRIDFLDNSEGSLKLEPQRTNLITYSSDFSDSDWVKYGSASVVANQAVSPDGTSNADLLNVRSANVIRQSVTLTASTTYTCSFFAKKTDYDIVGIQTLVSGSGVQSFFNLDTGVVSTQGTGHTASIEDYNSGWYRCIVSFNCGTSTSNIFDFLTNSTSLKGFYIYGAQIEQGSYATSYIPTQGSTVTRVADSCSQTVPDGVIGQTEGTMFCEIDYKDTSDTQYYISISDGTTNNRINVGYDLSLDSIYVFCKVGNVTQALMQTTSPASGVKKIAIGYKLNDYVLYVNGTQIAIDNTALVPACSNLEIGSFQSFGFEYPITQTQLYNTRLSNSELATLTTL